MKVTIFGAGAAGSVLAARLSQLRPIDITLIARGEHLEALQRNQLEVVEPSGTTLCQVKATDHPNDLPPQDYVIISTKAYSYSEVARSIRPLLGPKTAVIPAANGVPWWFADEPIKCLDPYGIIEKEIPRERIIGGFFITAAGVQRPGLVRNYRGFRLVVGEPFADSSDRCAKLAQLLENAGIPNPASKNIREDIWRKMNWSSPFNPLGTITGKTCLEMAEDPEISARGLRIIDEMSRLAPHLGLEVEIQKDQAQAMNRDAGPHKPSMLQDFEKSKPLEIESNLGALLELGQRYQIEMPEIQKTYSELKKKTES